MKKMLLATAGPAYYRMCSTDVYCSKQTGSSGVYKETITHHLYVSLKPTVDAAKICGGAENVEAETQQTFVNGLLEFYYFKHLYSAGSACVLLTIIA